MKRSYIYLLLLTLTPALWGQNWAVQAQSQTALGSKQATLRLGTMQAEVMLSTQPADKAKSTFLAVLRARSGQGVAEYYGSSQPFPSSTGDQVTLAKFTQTSNNQQTANLLAVFTLPEGQSLLVELSTPLTPTQQIDWDSLEAQFHLHYNNLISTFETVL
jgi:hypothetical protein